MQLFSKVRLKSKYIITPNLLLHCKCHYLLVGRSRDKADIKG